MASVASLVISAICSLAEGGRLGGALDFDETAVASHHDVHVDIGATVLVVAKVEEGVRFDDANADRRDRRPSRVLGRGRPAARRRSRAKERAT